MSETAILRKILIRASELGARLFRNQVGVYELKDGRYLTSGLCVGSSDLIGWTLITVTPDMVGKTVAVFTAIETKAPKKHATEAQSRFIDAVTFAGGIAGVAHSVEDVERITGDTYAQLSAQP